MIYNICQPAPILRPLIDIYWQISGHSSDEEMITLLPDGGVNLILNLGEDIISTGFEKRIYHEGVFLVGPMMKADVQIIRNEVMLYGVRFKPGAFLHFYKYESLDQITNIFNEFPHGDFPDIRKTIRQFATYLDQFYLDRLCSPRQSVLNCISDICQNVGTISIEALAKRHFTSERQLERQFKQQVGISPKKLADLERFRRAFTLISTRSRQSMEEIAWECGYYDHAHMTNDFKRFTGMPPIAFFLSDFSKEIASKSS